MESLRRIRKENSLRQFEVAELVGLKNQTYSRYELGQRKPSLAVLRKLADLYGVTIDELVSQSPVRGHDVKEVC
jgi:transcriptional regulator with XRE-family HTH domain